MDKNTVIMIGADTLNEYSAALLKGHEERAKTILLDAAACGKVGIITNVGETKEPG